MSQPHPLTQFFSYAHLPHRLQEVSAGFGELAGLIDQTLPANVEKDAAMRHLLEAKDAAVRAVLFRWTTP